MVDRWFPADVHVRIPRTCDYIGLPGEGVEVAADLEMGKWSWIIWGGGNGTMRVLKSGNRKQESQNQRGAVGGLFKCPLPALKMQEGAVSQGMHVSAGYWKIRGNGPSPRASGRNTALLTPCFQPSETLVRLPSHRTVR